MINTAVNVDICCIPMGYLQSVLFARGADKQGGPKMPNVSVMTPCIHVGLIFTSSAPPFELKQRPGNVVLQNAKMKLRTRSRGLTSAKK